MYIAFVRWVFQYPSSFYKDHKHDQRIWVEDNFVLFDLILYVPSTIFQLNRDGSSWVEPVLS